MSDKAGSLSMEISNTGIYRYALGSTLIMMVAMGADYSLAYLTPILSLGFLAPGTSRPGFKKMVLFLLSMGTAILIGLFFSKFFLPYPLVFIPLLILALFHIFYTDKFQPMKLWLIISLLLIPLISMKSPSSGMIVAGNLLLNAFLALLLVSFVWMIFPEKEIHQNTQQKQKSVSSQKERLLSAIITTMVVAPVVALFYIFGWTDSVLTMIFLAVLSMNPATSNKKAGMGIILANLGGGIIAILAFNLLTIVPNFVFMGLIVASAGLILAPKLFSATPLSPLFGMAYSTFLLILGNVTSIAGEAGEKVYSRIFQIGLAVLYMVIAFQVAGLIVKPSLKSAG